jgi:G patch domain-containing protein 1
MDSEDRGEEVVAGQTLTTKSDFSSSAKSSDLILDIIAPTRDPIGVRLLRTMGWKDGQRVGSSRPQRSGLRPPRTHTPVEAVKKVYSAELPPHLAANLASHASESDEEDRERDMKIQKDLLEARNPAVFKAKMKEDQCGIGYDPLKYSSEFLQDVAAMRSGTGDISSKNVTMKRGARDSTRGMGLSALEAPDAGDDVYSFDSIDQYDIEAGSTKSKARFFKQGQSDSESSAAKYHAAKLEFVAAERPPPPPIIYTKIDVPVDFLETHRFEAPGVQFADDIAPLMDRLGYSRLGSADRAVLLGEISRTTSGIQGVVASIKEPPPTPAPKTYDQLSDSDRKRLTSMLMKGFHSPGEFVSEKEKDEQRRKNEMQFSSDPQKQARFMLYLRHKRSLESGSVVPYEIATSDMTSWQLHREKDEFSKLITQFDLVPSQSASSTISLDSDASDLAKPLLDALVTRDAKASIAIQKSLASSEKPDFAAAARMKLFGRLTREKEEWRPHKLLCKRFGELDPFKDAAPPANSSAPNPLDSSNIKVLDMLGIGFAASTSLTPTIGTADGSSKTAGLSYLARPADGIRSSSEPILLEKSKSTSAVLELIKEEDKEPEEPVPEKPSIDLFRAIFEDSNDDAPPEEAEVEEESEIDSQVTSSSAHELQNALKPDSEAKSVLKNEDHGTQSPQLSSPRAAVSKNADALALSSSISTRFESTKSLPPATLKQTIKSEETSIKKEIAAVSPGVTHKTASVVEEQTSSSDDLIVETSEERLERLRRDQVRNTASSADWISKKPKKKVDDTSKKQRVIAEPIPSSVSTLLSEFDELRKQRKKGKKKSKAKKHEKSKKKHKKKSSSSSDSE